MFLMFSKKLKRKSRGEMKEKFRSAHESTHSLSEQSTEKKYTKIEQNNLKKICVNYEKLNIEDYL